jgi:hypothetical protein
MVPSRQRDLPHTNDQRRPTPPMVPEIQAFLVIDGIAASGASSRRSLQARWQRAIGAFAALLLLLAVSLGFGSAAKASLNDDRYDGNIFALYAGNGSLVPPRSSLALALEQQRVAVVVYYLDDSSVSKRFAPVVSELQRLWGNNVELIPLVTDPLQPGGKAAAGALPVGDPSRYWSGLIPQVVVFDRQGQVVFDASGQVEVDAINGAVSQATGLPLPAPSGLGSTRSFNELNSEVVSGGR